MNATPPPSSAEALDEEARRRCDAERQVADPWDIRRWLRPGRERRKNEADSENDREPDKPHGQLGGGWLSGVYRNATTRTTSVMATLRAATLAARHAWVASIGRSAQFLALDSRLQLRP